METNKNTNTHWRKVMNTTYLNGDEVFGEPIVTIKSYKEEMIYSARERRKEPQVTLEFVENKKPMIMTTRKAKQISAALETPLMSEWVGKKVVMFTVKEKHFGEEFEVIHFKRAPAGKEVFNDKHPRWNGAVDALQSGATTIEAIEKHYTLTKQVKEQLEKLSQTNPGEEQTQQ